MRAHLTIALQAYLHRNPSAYCPEVHNLLDPEKRPRIEASIQAELDRNRARLTAALAAQPQSASFKALARIIEEPP